jgi:hypothetical protein
LCHSFAGFSPFLPTTVKSTKRRRAPSRPQSIFNLSLDHRDPHPQRCPQIPNLLLALLLPPYSAISDWSTPGRPQSVRIVCQRPRQSLLIRSRVVITAFSPDSPKTFETRRRSSIRLTCPTHRWVTCQLLPTSSETYSVLQLAGISFSSQHATDNQPRPGPSAVAIDPKWQSDKRSRVPNQVRQLVALLPLSSNLPALFISPH